MNEERIGTFKGKQIITIYEEGFFIKPKCQGNPQSSTWGIILHYIKLNVHFILKTQRERLINYVSFLFFSEFYL